MFKKVLPTENGGVPVFLMEVVKKRKGEIKKHKTPL